MIFKVKVLAGKTVGMGVDREGIAVRHSNMQS